MKVKIMVTLFAVMLLAVSAFAGGSGNGCKLQGTWIGETPYPNPDGSYYNLRFFITINGTGDNEGTAVTEWVNPIPDPGTSWSNVKGIWEKSGPNRYEVMKIGHIYNNQSGNIMFVIRHRDTVNLTDCNTGKASVAVEYLSYPDMEPIMCIPMEVTIHRVLMQEPCQTAP